MKLFNWGGNVPYYTGNAVFREVRIHMPQITLKETITKKIEIPMDTLYELIDNLTDEERKKLLERLKAKPVKLKPFKKDKIESILADFAATDLYEDEFLKDLEEGLKKSSIYT
ncbi:MAG: hypothetical protein JRF46_16150 [Deltaproteobacteria bacterium]|nr:hypothetical protein [Deltaproteobacteria bacterium]MBW2301793.1 hypothetical protein [Deltaproteobacteria bacterium]